jgi:hypothetical protein
MTYTLRLTDGPAVEPVTLGEAKGHLSLAHDEDDALITRLIKSARTYFETATGITLVTQTFDATFGEWPKVYGVEDDEDEYSAVIPSYRSLPQLDIIALPFQSVESITADAVAWTAYTSIKVARGVRIKPTSTIPTGEIIVTFKAGYGDTAATVPSDIAHAIMMLVATLYGNRGALAIDTAGLKAASGMTPGFLDAINRYRVMV